MISIRRILCPVDFSDFSRVALAHAVTLSKWYGAEVIALHVAAPVVVAPLGDVAVYVPPSSLLPADRERLEDHIRRFVGSAFDGPAAVRPLVAEGEIVPEILGVARSIPADVIVLGAHGQGRIERLVLGSVTEKVVRLAPCPVLTIPAPLDEPPSAAAPFSKAIVCAVDFSEPSAASVKYAASLAERAGVRLTLIHVLSGLPEEDLPSLAHYNVPEYRSHLERDAMSRLEALLPHDLRSRLKPELVVASGKAYRQILCAAEERDAGAIVMGVHGRGALDVFLFGSTASQLIRRASCAVLTVRESPAAERAAA